MNHRERFLTAARRGKADRVPLDIWYTPEVRDRLLKHCGVATERELWDRLHLDRLVGVGPRYIGPPAKEFPDGTKAVPPWWVRVREVNYGTGTYTETVDWPLKNATTIAELEQYQWPSADWYDYSNLSKDCDQWPENPIAACYNAPFYWHNHIRGLEQSCIDLVAEPELTEFMLGKISDYCAEYATRIFEACKGKIQLTEITDDFGSQHGLIISRAMFQKWFKPIHKRLGDLARQAGLIILHHDDGAIRDIIPDLIEIGVDILNPIQHVCPGMEMEGLKRDFGSKLCFYGGVDNQKVLPFGTVDDVRREVRDCLRALSPNGGYILAPCHNVQPVSPMENVVAMFETAWEEGKY
jgi:uroporphyrinogen decarboxylase